MVCSKGWRSKSADWGAGEGIFIFPKIKREQNVGSVLCLPFAFTWLNAVAFVFYATNRHDWLVAGINCIATLVETYYCVRYLMYSTGWRRMLTWVMGFVQLSFLALMLALQFTVFNHGQKSDVRDSVYGIIGAVTAFLMYASSIIQAVSAFCTHDVAGLELAWAFLANAGIWTVYSWLSPMDWYLLIASAIGVVCTAFQCVVWLMFCNRQPQVLPPGEREHQG